MPYLNPELRTRDHHQIEELTFRFTLDQSADLMMPLTHNSIVILSGIGTNRHISKVFGSDNLLLPISNKHGNLDADPAKIFSIHPDDVENIPKIKDLGELEDNPYKAVYRLFIPGRGYRWVEDTTTIRSPKTINAPIVCCVLRDITEAKEKELDFENSRIAQWIEDFSLVKQKIDEWKKGHINENFTSFLEKNLNWVRDRASEVKILDVNQATLAMHGDLDKDTILARGIAGILDENSFPTFIGQLEAIFNGEKSYSSKKEIRARSNGKDIWVRINWDVSEGHENSYDRVNITVEEVTGEIEKAFTDGLTELYNQTHFKDRLRIELERAKRAGEQLSFLFVDQDLFKQVNDNYDHQVGDKMIWSTAYLIRKLLRIYDVAGRWGGEEYAIILPKTSELDAFQIAQRIHAFAELMLPILLEMCVEDYSINNKSKIIKFVDETIESFVREKRQPAATQYGIAVGSGRSFSIGVSSLKHEDNDSDELLLRRADHASYLSKLRGRNQITVWSPEIELEFDAMKANNGKVYEQ